MLEMTTAKNLAPDRGPELLQKMNKKLAQQAQALNQKRSDQDQARESQTRVEPVMPRGNHQLNLKNADPEIHA